MLTSRERVELALNHRQPDRVPLDLGACGQTGMHVSTVYQLRQALGLDEPGTPVKIIEPYQMLSEINLDLLEAVGGDIVGIGSLNTMFGYRCENWKPWTFHDGCAGRNAHSEDLQYSQGCSPAVGPSWRHHGE
jgi:hypothetical protein